MWLAIEGIVGAGKTTTAELIGEQTGLRAVIERSEDHPFLADYYRDPGRYALETEIAFMLLQLHQMRDQNPPTGVVTDFSPAKNLVFARTNSSTEDQRFLADLHDRLWSGFRQPDLAVFLDVPADACLTRITSRGRDYERGIQIADLELLQAEYLALLGTLGIEVEVVALDGTEPPDVVATAVAKLVG
jgi:deoxyguanosine kinase